MSEEVKNRKLLVAILNLFNRRGLIVPKRVSPFTVDNLEESLVGVDIIFKIEELKQLYNSNSHFQFESFEQFVKRVQYFKEQVDEIRYKLSRKRR